MINTPKIARMISACGIICKIDGLINCRNGVSHPINNLTEEPNKLTVMVIGKMAISPLLKSFDAKSDNFLKMNDDSYLILNTIL